MADVMQGYSSDHSPLFKEILAEDTVSPSVALRAEGNYHPTLTQTPFSTYFDADYAALEMEHVWKKTWQYACMTTDIPEVGDRYLYQLGDLSFIVVRAAENEFKAYYNACLHRGTRLCREEGGGDEIRCPFHGWSWNLDGSIKRIPAKWDFPQVDDDYRLPEIQVGVWGGCVFVNPDPAAGPLRDALGVLVDHFAHFDLGRRMTLVRTAKKVRANWKTVWAAFLEAYHVDETHFDAVEFTGDGNSQYDCFKQGDSVISRLITPAAVPSPYLGDRISRREAATIQLKAFRNALGPDMDVPLPEIGDNFGRSDVAAWRRETMGSLLGVDLSNLCDAEMIDSIQYAMFPNFGPWLGEGLPLHYQFLPLGSDPNESLFVVRLLAPAPDGEPVPPAPPMTYLDFDEYFESLPQWGRIAHVFDQDMFNLPEIQRGMRCAADARSVLTLGRYQEQRVALMHEFVEACITRGTR